MTSKDRAALRGIANGLDPIFQIGKEGVGPNLTDQVDLALEARELIKLRVLETAPMDAREVAHMVAPRVRAEVIQCIGRVFVLYRKSKDPKNSPLTKK